MKKTLTPKQFFYRHAGYGYDPAKETKRQGRNRCASALANAEKEALALGYSCQWDVDPTTDSSDFSDEKPAWDLWECICRDERGDIVASLGGVDFGRDGTPWGEPYKRVVEAELYLEALGNR